MFKVISKFATTDIVFANSHGPYDVDGGSPLTFTAGAANPHSTYSWDFGDGETGSGASVVHTYGNDGIFVATLTVKVNQPGGDTSKHFATVRVRNVPPIVNAGGDRTVYEGDVVKFSGSFTDVQWLETHEAIWDWGDSQKPDPGVVTETHNKPLGQGTVTASHAWGHSGVYPVTLSVQDKGGAIGRSRATVTVLNVPPTVDAGPEMFAYPCSVLTLHGKFTDPSWLDTHAGFWDFGDCSGPQRAVIREKHDPPIGVGDAIASHVYHKCGVYHAVCTVIDDVGGVGTAWTVVRVVDIRNAGFEDGYCSRDLGIVGNYWTPYLAQVPVLFVSVAAPPASIASPAGADIFQAEQYCVHGGQRSQRITFVGKSRAGILQDVGANPGWDYQISVWYSLNEKSGGKSKLLKEFDNPEDMFPSDATGGMARLGIDPTGGKDPSSSDIVWSEGYLRPEWSQLSVRATATGSAITIFLEGQGWGRLGVDVFFDDAALLAVQPFCPPETPKPPKRTEVCTDFSKLRPETQLPPVFVQDGFTFTARDGQTQVIVPFGPPAGQNALKISPRGLEVDLPFLADMVRVTVAGPQNIPILVGAFDSAGNLVTQATTPPSASAQTVTLNGSAMAKVRIVGKEGAFLIRICAHPDAQQERPPDGGPAQGVRTHNT